MSDMPEAVQVGPYCYTVALDGDEIARQSREAGMRMTGASNHEGQAIYVHPDLGPDARAETLLHECLHAIFVGPIETGLDGAAEETLITSLGYALLDLLRRNPELVRFLMGGSSWENTVAATVAAQVVDAGGGDVQLRLPRELEAYPPPGATVLLLRDGTW